MGFAVVSSRPMSERDAATSSTRQQERSQRVWLPSETPACIEKGVQYQHGRV